MALTIDRKESPEKTQEKIVEYSERSKRDYLKKVRKIRQRSFGKVCFDMDKTPLEIQREWHAE